MIVNKITEIMNFYLLTGVNNIWFEVCILGFWGSIFVD